MCVKWRISLHTYFVAFSIMCQTLEYFCSVWAIDYRSTECRLQNTPFNFLPKLLNGKIVCMCTFCGSSCYCCCWRCCCIASKKLTNTSAHFSCNKRTTKKNRIYLIVVARVFRSVPFGCALYLLSSIKCSLSQNNIFPGEENVSLEMNKS